MNTTAQAQGAMRPAPIDITYPVRINIGNMIVTADGISHVDLWPALVDRRGLADGDTIHWFATRFVSADGMADLYAAMYLAGMYCGVPPGHARHLERRGIESDCTVMCRWLKARKVQRDSDDRAEAGGRG